jgi:hypothetical protein
MDAIAPVIVALQTVGALALLFVVPGLTWGPLLAPGPTTPLGAAGRAVAASVLTAAATCTLLAVLGLLAAPLVVGALLVLTAVPLASRHVRAEVLRRPRWSRRGPRWTHRVRRWWLGAMCGLVVAAALVVVPSRQEVGPDLLPFTSTVWYYANLARAVAETGGFPQGLPEWGAIRPFQSDYLPVTAHTAAALQLLPGDLLFALEAYRLAILGGVLVVAALLFRRWVSTWLALLAACLLAGTVRLDFKLLSYKPETFGLLLALACLWLADRAMAERSRRLTVAAVLFAAGVFLCHAEVFLLLGPALVGLAVARLVVQPSRPAGRRAAGGVGRWRHWLGLRLPTRDRRAFVSLALALGIFAAGGALGALGNGLLTGELRLLGYLGGEPSPAEVPRPTILPEGWTFTDDPTWDFYVAAVAPAQLGRQPPASFFDRRLLARATVHVWPGLDGRERGGLVTLGALVALPWLAWPWLDARRRRLLVTWAVFGIGLFAGSYLLFAISDTYVPQRVGPRRLMPYELLVPVVAAITLLWGLDRLLRDAWRALLPRRGAMLAAGLALAVLTAGAIAPAPDAQIDEDREPGLTRIGYDAYRWLDANLPADARVLANAYTDGSLTGLSRRIGILDGRAVYLEDPRFLGESTALVLGARVVFGEPASPDAARFLGEQRVSHLLVAGAGSSGADLGGYLPFETDLASLAGSARYTLLQSFGDGRLLLYEVAPPS